MKQLQMLNYSTSIRFQISVHMVSLDQSLTTIPVASQADKLYILSKQDRNSETYITNRNQSLPEAEECTG